MVSAWQEIRGKINANGMKTNGTKIYREEWKQLTQVYNNRKLYLIYLRFVLEVNEAKERDKIGLTYNNEEVVAQI